MAGKEYLWVKVGPEPYLAHCERCGVSIDKPALPTPIPAFVKYCEYAGEAHRFCQEEDDDRERTQAPA